MLYIFPHEVEDGIISAAEEAAIAAYSKVGFGDEVAADKAAQAAMFEALNSMTISGNIVFGEGDNTESEFLYEGAQVGEKGGLSFDIALDALEGTMMAAKAMPNALSVIAISKKGGLLQVPDIYMEKIAVGPNYPKDIIDIDKSVEENLNALAAYKNIEISEIGVCVLDRPRHSALIAKIREVGARVILISDGDVAGVICTTEPKTNIDIYMGTGGAQEGVFAAAALSCVGGQFQARFVVRSREDKLALERVNINDTDKKYTIEDLVKSDVIFALCGITNCKIVKGVTKKDSGVETNTLVFNSQKRMIRTVRTLRLK